MLEQINEPIDYFSGDGAYDETPVYYEAVHVQSPDANVVIPHRSNAVVNEKAVAFRNRNIRELEAKWRMKWQKERQYGRRNYGELDLYWYQRALWMPEILNAKNKKSLCVVGS